MNYRESCNHRVNMWGIERDVEAFCAIIRNARDLGKISAESAERQFEVATDVEIAIMDKEATAETWSNLKKMRDFTRRFSA